MPNLESSRKGDGRVSGSRLRPFLVAGVAGAVVLSPFASPPATAAGASAVQHCAKRPHAVVRTLEMRGGGTTRITAHVGDTIKVIARMRHYYMTSPKPDEHRSAVCEIAHRRGTHGKAIAWFRTLRTRDVRFFSAGKSHDGDTNAEIGFANITDPD